MLVQQIMTANPITVEVTDPLERVEELLLGFDVRHLPVVEGGVLKGIISDRDIGAAKLEDAEHARARSASEIMTRDVLTVDPKAELVDVVDTLLDQRVGALPVVDTETRELVGIVSYVDVLRALRPET